MEDPKQGPVSCPAHNIVPRARHTGRAAHDFLANLYAQDARAHAVEGGDAIAPIAPDDRLARVQRIRLHNDFGMCAEGRKDM